MSDEADGARIVTGTRGRLARGRIMLAVPRTSHNEPPHRTGRVDVLRQTRVIPDNTGVASVDVDHRMTRLLPRQGEHRPASGSRPPRPHGGHRLRIARWWDRPGRFIEAGGSCR